MGYQPNRTVYTLIFDDMDGLEVRARSVPLGAMLEMRKLSSLAERVKRGEISDDDVVTETSKAFPLLASALVSWNVEREDGTPCPATLEGLYEQEPGFVMEVVKAWASAVTAVPAPLAGPSDAGSPFPEASMPMETLSPSLAS